MFKSTCPSLSLIAATGAVLLLTSACSQPARPERMSIDTVPAAAQSVTPPGTTLFVTVYGNAGGFASHYYPLPREDFEAALKNSIAANALFGESPASDGADFDLNVGLVSLVAPKWSGTVTLETSWSVSSGSGGEVIARKMIRSEEPSPFGKVREATEEASRKNIEYGLAWLESTIAPTEEED